MAQKASPDCFRTYGPSVAHPWSTRGPSKKLNTVQLTYFEYWSVACREHFRIRFLNLVAQAGQENSGDQESPKTSTSFRG